MDIDIVYTWCDIADAKWRLKREATAKKFGIDSGSDANGSCRCRSNDDLRYSLRSVEQFAPWVRKVFIIVDDDATLPDWLNQNHPKLRIVHHSEILSAQHRPCFCSGSIEHSIVNIPDLSEYFIYSNDDTLFYSPATPGFFFAKDGYPIFRFAGKYNQSAIDKKSVYMLNMERAREVFSLHHKQIARASQWALQHWPHHNIDAYRKSDMLATHNEYAKEIEYQLGYPFRRKENVQRFIYTLEALQRKHGHTRLSSFNTSPYGGFLRRLMPSWADSLFLMNDLWYQSPKMLKRLQPKLICYNDTGSTTDEARAWLKEQYARLYPFPSTFERS